MKQLCHSLKVSSGCGWIEERQLQPLVRTNDEHLQTDRQTDTGVKKLLLKGGQSKQAS